MRTLRRHPPTFLPFTASLLAISCLLAATPEKGPPAYTLFMGADIALERGKSFYRVEDVTGSYFKIRVDGKEEMIPTRNGTARMRIDNSLKLAGTPIALGHLNAERSYTPARDPHRKFQQMAAAAAGASAAADLSTFRMNQAELNLSATLSNPYATQQQIADATYQRDTAIQSQYQSALSIGSDINSPGYHAQQLEAELAEENFDAIKVTMEVASPVRIEDPYLLVIARIHERDEKPGVFRNWIFAQKLDPVDSTPQKIFINQGGLPVGYNLEDYQVRLYNRGRELPTSVSPNRVGLSRDEARQYVLIEHLAANKDATMPALPVFGQAPADLKGRLAAGEFAKPYFIEVDADGNALGAFTDEKCTSAAADPYVSEFVAGILFVPALENGKPVSGVARLQFGALLN